MRYLGPGGMSTYSGTYTISDNNQLICNIDTEIHTDVSPNGKASFIITFKIIDSKKIQLESISNNSLYNNKSIGKIFEK